MDKKQRQTRQQQEDMALNRGLLWVCGAIVLELLLLLVNKYYINYRTTSESIAMAEAFRDGLTVIRWLALAGVAACGVWAALQLRKKSSAAKPLVALAVSAALLVCAHVSLHFKGPGVRMLFLLVPAWAGLALVYYLYQREFFLAAVGTVLAALGLWLVRMTAGSLLYSGVMMLAIAAVGLAAYLLKKNGGCVKLNGQQVRLMPKGSSYSLIFLTCGVGLVAMLAALAAGSTVAYYLMYVMVVWLFGLLVYYTVKMM